jgi:hypothetical protein
LPLRWATPGKKSKKEKLKMKNESQDISYFLLLTFEAGGPGWICAINLPSQNRALCFELQG